MTNNVWLYQVREDLIINPSKIIYIRKNYIEGNVRIFAGNYEMKIESSGCFIISEQEYKALMEEINRFKPQILVKGDRGL